MVVPVQYGGFRVIATLTEVLECIWSYTRNCVDYSPLRVVLVVVLLRVGCAYRKETFLIVPSIFDGCGRTPLVKARTCRSFLASYGLPKESVLRFFTY